MKQLQRLLNPRRLCQEYVMTMHLQNQRLLQGLLKFQFISMWKSSVFLLENMVLMENLRSFQQGGLSRIVHTLQRNGKRTSASIVKHGPTMTWKGSGSKPQRQSMTHINEVLGSSSSSFRTQLSSHSMWSNSSGNFVDACTS